MISNYTDTTKKNSPHYSSGFTQRIALFYNDLSPKEGSEIPLTKSSESVLKAIYSDMGLTSDGRERDLRFAGIARRFLLSTPYSVFCVVMAILNLVLLIWEIIDMIEGQPIVSHWVFKVLEVCVNVTLIAEIALRATSQQRDYCKYWGNILDCVVLVASLSAFVILMSGVNFLDSIEGIAFGLITFRYFIACLRVIIILKNQSKYIAASAARVDISTIEPIPPSFEDSSVTSSFYESSSKSFGGGNGSFGGGDGIDDLDDSFFDDEKPKDDE